MTDYQKRGRGRLNRRWETPPGEAILLSVLLKPAWPPARVPWLSMIAGLAAVNALQTASRLNLRLKWPNDVILPPAKDQLARKVGGILLESALAGGWVLGLGLNINQREQGLPDAPTPSASLHSLTGRSFDRPEIVRTLLHRLESLYEQANQGQSPLPEWRRTLDTLGRLVTVHPVGDRAPWPGRAVEVDAGGRLFVEDEQGAIHAITAGDVSLRPR